MGSKRLYEIAFVGLKPGEHTYNYELNKEFFIEKGTEDAQEMTVKVKLLLEKNNGFMILKFYVDGHAEVLCDRCGNALQVNLWDEFTMVVKLTENAAKANEDEEDADLYYIERTESILDVSDWLYEFALLSVPIQNYCNNSADGKSLCNQEVINKLEQMKIAAQEKPQVSIWKGLEKFKDN